MGEWIRWTNSAFGGTPTYQTTLSYKSTGILSEVVNAYHLWLPKNVWYTFAYLLGSYTLLRAFGFRKELVVLDSVIWAFSSYFFVITVTGHIWKVMALAYLSLMMAGIVFSYRGEYLWRFVLAALFVALEVEVNHVQMTCYYLFIIFSMIIAFLVQAVRKRQLARFSKAPAVYIAAAAIDICISLNNLCHA